MKRRFYGFIGIVAAAGGIVLLVSIARETLGDRSDVSIPASWGTYRNERYGFEVRYPEGYRYDDNVELKRVEEEFAVFFYSGDQREPETNTLLGMPKFTVLKIKNEPELSLALWMTEKLPQASKEAEKGVAFGGNRYARIAQSGAAPFYAHLVAGEDAVFMVSTPQYDVSEPGVYREILSSFRAY